MPDALFIVDIGPDGAVAVHPRQMQLPGLLAPIPDEQKGSAFNTLRQPLITIGCMRLPHTAFEFDSSFVSPDSADRFNKFAKFMLALQQEDSADPKRFPPISIFGHADPTGGDQYNKPLSGRRALAVYALLTHNVKIWDTLFNNAYGGDTWGQRSIRRMLSIALKPDEDPFFNGPVEPDDSTTQKQIDAEERKAVAAYQGARGLPASGVADAKTRDSLFSDYMNAICQDDQGNPFTLNPKTDFLARNQDAATHRGDVQGCSDFNPIFLLSKKEEDKFKALGKDGDEARNQLYSKDRRVLAYVFKHGSQVSVSRWPCPAALTNANGIDASNAACKLRFWSDADKRRKIVDDRRVFGKNMDLAVVDGDGFPQSDDDGNVLLNDVEDTGNTMACRFYHAFAVYSPCEAGLKEWIVRFRIDGFAHAGKPAEPVALANRRYVVIAGETDADPVIRGTLDKNGELRIPVLDPHVKMTVKLDAFGALFDPSSSGAAKPGQDTPQQSGSQDGAKPDANGLVDGKFPDEDQFMPLILDGGQLKEMSSDEDVDDLASKQRLYNLGFGPGNPAKWDDEKDLKPAQAAYRRARGLAENTDIRDALVNEHELQGAPPPLDPDDDPTAPPDPGTGT